MILSHPFLENEVAKVLKDFTDVHRSMQNENTPKELVAAIEDGNLDFFLQHTEKDKKVWIRRHPGGIFEGEVDGYNRSNVKQLFRFLRNMYQHHKGTKLQNVFVAMQSEWQYIHYLIHPYSYFPEKPPGQA